jgi:hypothetical protein
LPRPERSTKRKINAIDDKISNIIAHDEFWPQVLMPDEETRKLT